MKFLLIVLLISSSSVLACNYQLKIKKINNIEIDSKVLTKMLSTELESRGFYPGIGKYLIKLTISITLDQYSPNTHKSKISMSVYRDNIMENYVLGLGDRKISRSRIISLKQYSRAIKSAVSNLPFCNQ